MARYKDADALIENIKRVYCTDCNNYNEVRCRACGTDDVMAMIEDAPTADVVPRAEWISVEERLPESNDRCIVWSFDYIWRIRFASYNNGTKRWYVVCGGEIKDTQRDGVKVTHWLPIPEPPKGDHHE